MDQHTISINYNSYPNRSQLIEDDILLLQDAGKASEQAYAPYSKFNVGVAIRTFDGYVVTGSNQENGSFPVGQCAERVALYRLNHEIGRTPIESIAIIVNHPDQKTPASPCGSCRQMLIEYRSFQDQPIRLLLGVTGNEMVYEISDIRDLLPLSFDGSFLGV